MQVMLAHVSKHFDTRTDAKTRSGFKPRPSVLQRSSSVTATKEVLALLPFSGEQQNARQSDQLPRASNQVGAASPSSAKRVAQEKTQNKKSGEERDHGEETEL